MSVKWQTGRTQTNNSSSSSERGLEHKRTSSMRRDSRGLTFAIASSLWKPMAGSRTSTSSLRCGNSTTIRTRRTTARLGTRLPTLLGGLLLLSLVAVPTVSALGVPDGPSVTLGNQTVASTNGTVTVDVTLPDGGYVVVHSGRYVFDDRPDPVGRTDYLAPGEHTVMVALDDRALSSGSSGHFAAVAHRDGGGDETFTRYSRNLSADPPYMAGGDVVDDTGTLSSPGTTTPAPATTQTATTETPTPTVTTTPQTGGTVLGGLSLLETGAVALGGILVVAALAVLITGGRE